MYLFELVCSFSQVKYTEVEYLDYMVVLFLILLVISILFSIVAVPTDISTNSVQGFPFLHILSGTCSFGNCHSNRCELISYCGFDLHFSDSDVEHLFTWQLSISISSQEKYLFGFSTQVFDWIVGCFAIEVFEGLICFGY